MSPGASRRRRGSPGKRRGVSAPRRTAGAPPIIFVPRHPWRAALRSAALGMAVFGAVAAFGLFGTYLWLVPVFVLLLYGRGVWRFHTDRARLTIVLQGDRIEGPGATRWSKRVVLRRGTLDRGRSGRASLVERFLGYRNLYAKGGQAISVDVILLGPEQSRELLAHLKL